MVWDIDGAATVPRFRHRRVVGHIPRHLLVWSHGASVLVESKAFKGSNLGGGRVKTYLGQFKDDPYYITVEEERALEVYYAERSGQPTNELEWNMATRKWGEHPNDGKGLERISERLEQEKNADEVVRQPDSTLHRDRNHPRWSGTGDPMNPLSKRTAMLEVAGAGAAPKLEIVFATIDDMRAASDWIRQQPA